MSDQSPHSPDGPKVRGRKGGRRPLLTRSAEIATILGLLLTAALAYWGLRGDTRGTSPAPADVSIGNETSLPQAGSLDNETVAANETTADQNVSGGAPQPSGSAPTEPSVQTPTLEPRIPAPRQSGPPPTYAPPGRSSPSLEEQATFILGNWRHASETCEHRLRFVISGNTLYIYEGPNLNISYTIERVQNDTLILAPGGRFTLEGRRLRHVEANGNSQYFEACR
jgi:hypothetical protein